jgi:hypothetical protein
MREGGAMNEVQRHDGSFIVRIWWERGGVEPHAQPHWRGWVQHARTGRQLYFQSFESLLAFIEQETGTGAAFQADTSGGLV